MKTTITDAGVVSTKEGNGLEIYSKEYHEAPFDDRWDDQYAEIDNGTGPAQLTYEAYRDTGYFTRFFRHNQNDLIFMKWQMSHQWHAGTSVYPHMHALPMVSGSGDVIMTFAYTWVLVNSGTMPAASGWTSGSVSASYTPAEQYQQRIIGFGEVAPPADAGDSAVLVFKVERPAASEVLDTYSGSKDHGTAAANLGILFFDIHYQKIKAGSITPYPEAS